MGSTALYHYFESKLHCLFEIMSDTLLSFRTVFDDVTGTNESFDDAFLALLHANFDLTEPEVFALPGARGGAGPAQEGARRGARERRREQLGVVAHPRPRGGVVDTTCRAAWRPVRIPRGQIRSC